MDYALLLLNAIVYVVLASIISGIAEEFCSLLSALSRRAWNSDNSKQDAFVVSNFVASLLALSLLLVLYQRTSFDEFTVIIIYRDIDSTDSRSKLLSTAPNSPIVLPEDTTDELLYPHRSQVYSPRDVSTLVG